MKLWVLPLVLIAISVFDLVTTSIGIHFGFIEERNPIALKVIEIGGISFLVVWKLSLTFGGIFIIEVFRRKKLISNNAVENIYVATILLYVVVYTVATIVVNFA